jgi:putative membrane protein
MPLKNQGPDTRTFVRTDSTAPVQGDSLQLSTDELALQRTRLAHERTMMAWIRTSTSMITLGFGIYKFFDYFRGEHPIAQAPGIITPRRFAIFMIGMGLLVLAGAAVENWSELRRLRRAGRVPRSLATAVAALVSILGILALIAVILRQ